MKCSFGQEIELKGKYGASFIGGETIEFVGTDSFYFSGFYCTNGFHGKGRCEIRNSYLYLYFEKAKGKDNKDSVKSQEITRTQTNDSVTVVNIKCVKADGSPVPYSTVQLTRNRKATIDKVSDSLGYVSFEIRKNDMPLTIKTLVIGSVPKEIKIEDYGSYNIRIFPKEILFDEELNSGEVFVYEIDELSEDLILMRPESSREPFRKYRKRL